MATAGIALAQQKPEFDGKSWWQHVSVLADDKMEGRGTGTPGLERAEAYVVDQLKRAGAQPAGTRGYYQPINFRTRQLDESKSSLEIVTNGKAQIVTLGDDAIMSTRVQLAPEVNAPLVFVGYGLRIPEANYDDFSGLDVKGKVLVTITGSPANVPGPLSSHYQSGAERAKLLRELGAVGFVTLPNPATMDLPWARIASSRKIPAMVIDDEALNETKGVGFAAYWNPSKSGMIFSGSGHSFDDLAVLAKERKPLPHFDLGKSVKAKATLIQTKVQSSNVVAKIPGSDPNLKKEYVVLSAHVDHLGIGPAIDGDSLYNGAMDNASGTAALLDIAQSLKSARLKRSVLFVFVTGEEKGLLGSDYFAAHPTVPANSIVADVNTDMFLPIFPMKKLIVYGLNESSLGNTFTQVAKENGIQAIEDPEPLLNHFIRSDQYNFIKIGVPSVALKLGFDPGSEEEKKVHEWSKQRYHAPSDDLKQPVDVSAAAMFEQVVHNATVAVANEQHRPSWDRNSFFRRYAAEGSAGK